MLCVLVSNMKNLMKVWKKDSRINIFFMVTNHF